MIDLRTIPAPVPTTRMGVARERTDLCIWHATAGGTARSSLEWIARPGSSAGYHVVIERDGSVLASTPLPRIAWHAGRSAWPVPPGGVTTGSVNARSIGVAFANRNDGVEAVTDAQWATALELAAALAARYPALRSPDAHLRHRDVSPGRKTDPHPGTFDWPAFRAALATRLARVAP